MPCEVYELKMSDEDLTDDPDLMAWQEERLNRHRRSSFENEQIQYLRLNLPPSTMNLNAKGSISANNSPVPEHRRKISLAGLTSLPRKRRMSRAGSKVAEIVRNMHNNNSGQVGIMILRRNNLVVVSLTQQWFLLLAFFKGMMKMNKE